MLLRFFSSVPTRIQILSKPNCCLCDQALFQISRLVDNIKSGNPEKKFLIEKINIENDPDLSDEYALVIPVVKVNDKVVTESVIDIPKLRKVLH
jgi:hypothetical protein